jgi:predicted transcriptional regulator of viral defense system
MELIQKLAALDRQGVYVLAKRDVEKLFPDEGEKSLAQSLKRMVGDGLLQRVARGLYVNPAASSKNRWIGEEIAKALRPGQLSYLSLESILSEYGVISQIHSHQAQRGRDHQANLGAQGAAPADCHPRGRCARPVARGA